MANAHAGHLKETFQDRAIQFNQVYLVTTEVEVEKCWRCPVHSVHYFYFALTSAITTEVGFLHALA